MSEQASATPFTGRKLLLCIVAFFAVVIAANAVMATLALRSHTGLIVPNTYVASQDFNGLLAADRAQRALGWRTELAVSDGQLAIRILDASGAPAPVRALTARVGRTVTDDHDQSLSFERDSDGAFVADVELRPGVWRLDAEAVKNDGGAYRIIHEFAAPASRS